MDIYVDVFTKNREKHSVLLKGYINHVNSEIGRRFRKAIIICPGGAYAFRSATEGEYVAVKYQACGFQAFVLEYSVGHISFPRALEELASSVRFVRENADVLDVNPNEIYVCGFSAGGHLAASLGVFWNSYVLGQHYSDVSKIRPTGLILCYPVITNGKYAHRETIENIAEEMSEEEKKILSLEEQVSKDTPPVFIWHTLEDDTVPVENTLLFATALKQKGISFELHIFPKGKHGLSLATEYTAVSEDHINAAAAEWFQLSVTWLGEVGRNG